MRRIIKSIFIASLLMELLLTNNLCHVFADYTFECVQEIRNIGAESGYILSTPTSIDKDNNGNYYIADLANNRVLKLDRNMNNRGQGNSTQTGLPEYQSGRPFPQKAG